MRPRTGASVEAVSKALKHRFTTTTERYCMRIRAEDAFAELEDVFSRPAVKIRKRSPQA